MKVGFARVRKVRGGAEIFFSVHQHIKKLGALRSAAGKRIFLTSGEECQFLLCALGTEVRHLDGLAQFEVSRPRQLPGFAHPLNVTLQQHQHRGKACGVGFGQVPIQDQALQGLAAGLLAAAHKGQHAVAFPKQRLIIRTLREIAGLAAEQ